MALSFPAIDPAAQIRDYRNNYVNISALAKTTALPPSMSVMAPTQQPIMNLDLPAALRDAMAAFQKTNPDGRTLTAVKYMRITNGNPDIVIEDDSPLPAENDLVTFSHTVSALSINSASIVTHQLVATLASTTGAAIA
jgi:hypothetical protein